MDRAPKGTVTDTAQKTNQHQGKNSVSFGHRRYMFSFSILQMPISRILLRSNPVIPFIPFSSLYSVLSIFASKIISVSHSHNSAFRNYKCFRLKSTGIQPQLDHRQPWSSLDTHPLIPRTGIFFSVFFFFLPVSAKTTQIHNTK